MILHATNLVAGKGRVMAGPSGGALLGDWFDPPVD